MSTRWGTTNIGTFEVVQRPPFVGVMLGAPMLIIAGYFVYWLASGAVVVMRDGTWRDAVASVPGIIVALVMAALFAVPGSILALRTRRTVCHPADRRVTITTFYGFVRRRRQIPMSEVQEVVARLKARHRPPSGEQRMLAPESVHAVEIVGPGSLRLEVTRLDDWKATQDLARALAAQIGAQVGTATL